MPDPCEQTNILGNAQNPSVTPAGSVFRPDATGVMNNGPCPDSTGFMGSAPQPLTTSAPLPSNASTPDRIGSYRLLRKLGQGGMGAVYLARGGEPDAPLVAIKTLSRDFAPDEQSIRRFHKEAAMLRESAHENVANLLDFGEENGECYLVLEFVEGVDVREMIFTHKPFPERLGLEVIRDVAAALEVAHRRGIVHRDLKPSNILLGLPNTGEENDDPAGRIREELDAGRKPVVKLSDFGLARQLDQSETMALTQTGAMLGTPYYIAPEQCSGTSDLVPATDIYSLGATLFHMLAGRPPFESDDPVKLITMHSFEAPPDLRRLNPDLSDGVTALVNRMLAKAPADRFLDGGHLRVEVERLLSGSANQVESRPEPPSDGATLHEAIWTWELDSPAEKIWPLVTSTDRVNEALGLPAATYKTGRDENDAVVNHGSFKLGWAKLKWEEHPFEWVEGRRLGILREFEKGPFDWFLSRIEVTPRKEGGCRLEHQVQIATSSLLGRLLAFIEVGLKGKRGLDRVYRRIDEVVSGKQQGGVVTNPFREVPALPKRADNLLAMRETQLRDAGLDGQSVSTLIGFLREGASQELARIRPRVFAHRFHLDEEPAFTVLLHACRLGLLELHWDILCPTCRVSSSVADTIQDIQRHTRCEACDLDFETDFGRSIELIFRVHPEIRTADLNTYCVGGPDHAPHVVAQLQLQPAESFSLELDLSPGRYVLRGPQLPFTVPIQVLSTGGSPSEVLPLSENFQGESPRHLANGRQILFLENQFSIPMRLRIERANPRTDILTAREASGHPLFREQFPAETLSQDQLSDLSTCTVVGLRVTNLEELYGQHGDLASHLLVSKVIESIKEETERVGGQVAKQSDDRILATFPTTSTAIEFALLVRETSHREGLQLATAMHRGTAMATTMNGQSSFIGRTITVASLLTDRLTEFDFRLSEEFGSDPTTAGFFTEHGYRVDSSGEGRNIAYRAQPEK